MIDSITPRQIYALSFQAHCFPQTYTLRQNYRGSEHSTDHIHVEGPTHSFRIDDNGQVYDQTTKETEAK